MRPVHGRKSLRREGRIMPVERRARQFAVGWDDNPSFGSNPCNADAGIVIPAYGERACLLRFIDLSAT
jgi:hypothetical protein